MKFIGIEETAKTTKGLRNQWGPRVEIRYSVNNDETSEVEVYGKWYMTDSEFSEWNEAWKYAGTTRRPLTQKAIIELVLSALKQNEDK